MKQQSLKLPIVIFAIGLVLCLVVCLLSGVIRTPTITEQDFHYSATYRYSGETKTIEGVYTVRFTSVGGGIDPQERYYQGFYANATETGEPESHIIAKQGDNVLQMVFIFSDDYLMGETYADENPDPYLAVYDLEGAEYSDEESLEKFDAELISWQMPQPIENEFVFSGFVLLHSGSMMPMLLVGLLAIVACLIFVKREEAPADKVLDKLAFAFNLVIAVVAMPFITLVVALMPIYVSGDELIYKLDLCIPALIAFTIAASVALRRKGYSKTGFCIQFVGPVLFAISAIVESNLPV